ncbi:hypothetical protein B0H13DRAFT_2543789 [Mycena leptocephala]|nr:hypothetical protein B0H13DRAFT_2543789 [Mycena leptocephala]
MAPARLERAPPSYNLYWLLVGGVAVHGADIGAVDQTIRVKYSSRCRIPVALIKSSVRIEPRPRTPLSQYNEAIGKVSRSCPSMPEPTESSPANRHAEIWLPRAAAQYHCPVDMVYGSFIVSIDQYFRQHSSATCLHLEDSNIPAVSAPLSILAVLEDAATTVHGSGGISAGSDEYYQQTSRVYNDTRQLRPPHSTPALVLQLPAIRLTRSLTIPRCFPRPSPVSRRYCRLAGLARRIPNMEIRPSYLRSGKSGALYSSQASHHAPPNHYPAYHRRYGCRRRARVPLSHARTASLVSPTSHCPLLIHRLHGRRPCLLGSLSSCTLRAPAMALPLSVGFAGGWGVLSPKSRRIYSDSAFLVDGVGLRGRQELRAKRAGRAVSIPCPSGSGAVHGDADPTCMENKVLPYRSPRETLRAQASVASGPERASASTTTMCRCYSPVIHQSSEARASFRPRSWVPDPPDVVILPGIMSSSIN